VGLSRILYRVEFEYGEYANYTSLRNVLLDRLLKVVVVKSHCACSYRSELSKVNIQQVKAFSNKLTRDTVIMSMIANVANYSTPKHLTLTTFTEHSVRFA